MALLEDSETQPYTVTAMTHVKVGSVSLNTVKGKWCLAPHACVYMCMY